MQECMYNERDSQTSRHKITLDSVDMSVKSINKSFNLVF